MEIELESHTDLKQLTEDDLYKHMKELERELEFLQIQEDYIKDE